MAGYKNYVRQKDKYKNKMDIHSYNYNYQKADETVRKFEKTISTWRRYCEYWKSYPDKFLDTISDENTFIKLKFFQRLLLRIFFRYQKVFLTACRGSSKTFIEILAQMLWCIMHPRAKRFICAPGKEQAARISQEKINEIFKNWSLLRREVKIYQERDNYTKLVFHNGAELDILPMKEGARGSRRHGGCIEEIVSKDFKKDILHEVIIPIMTNPRFAANGEINPNEVQRAEWYVTTAGLKQSYAYEKMVEVMRDMAQGKSAFNIGFGYDLPLQEGMFDDQWIHDQKESSASIASFEREFNSVWTGSSEDALVSFDDIDKCRSIMVAEEKAVNKPKEAEYVLAYDTARFEGAQYANSCLAVVKIVPRGDGTYQKHLVNLIGQDGTHTREQALFLKRKVNEYGARVLIVDALGIGRAVIDDLVLEIDENPPYAVINDDRYKKYRKTNSIDILYAIQGNTKETKNTYIHEHFMQIMKNQGVKLLVNENIKKSEIMKTKKRTNEKQIAEELRPFIETDLLVEEIMNLEYKRSGNNVKVERISRAIPNDKYMALAYALYWIYLLEQKNKVKKEKTVKPEEFVMMKSPSLVG